MSTVKALLQAFLLALGLLDRREAEAAGRAKQELERVREQEEREDDVDEARRALDDPGERERLRAKYTRR